MAKRSHAHRRRPQSSSSSTSTSSSSSSCVSDGAASSCSSCTSSASFGSIPAVQTQNESFPSSQQERFHSETAVHTLHQQGLLRNKVLAQAPQFDPKDGAIVYATTSKAAYARSCAKKQLSDHLSRAQHYCCKQEQCSLCKDVSCTKRAKLMLAYVHSISTQKRGNKAKCNSMLIGFYRARLFKTVFVLMYDPDFVSFDFTKLLALRDCQLASNQRFDSSCSIDLRLIL